jgi:F-type H+-transporting ATPase subunit b
MGAAQQIAETFGLSWGTFIPYLINFIIILVVLRIFAYKPILAMLDERRKTIAQSMQEAQRIKEELAKTQSMREEILVKANDTAERMIKEARQAAEKHQDQKLKEALQQAEDVLRKAQQAGLLEREKMMADLRREMVNLVIATTTRVTGKILTPEDQKRLQEETLKELAA